MNKNFTDWSNQKEIIHGKEKEVFCHVRELWWCALGLNIGSEQDGAGKEYSRPVLVLKSFSADTSLVIPLTTSVRPHPLRPPVGMVGGKDANALLSQMRVIDTKRLVRKIGYLDQDIFEKIRKAVKELL